MKKELAWPQFIQNLLIMVGSRHRSHLKRPTWIIALVFIVCFFLIAAYIYPLRSPSTCSFFNSESCGAGGTISPPPPVKTRELTDAEVESRVVINEILKYYPVQTKVPKVAFLFLTPGSLPFEKLWHMFFEVWDSYSIDHILKFHVFFHKNGCYLFHFCFTHLIYLCYSRTSLFGLGFACSRCFGNGRKLKIKRVHEKRQSGECYLQFLTQNLLLI